MNAQLAVDAGKVTGTTFEADGGYVQVAAAKDVLLSTVDGLRINEDMQVLGTQSKPIEGLYAAGDCSGSIFGNNYPEYIVACARGRTITFACHAVRHIAGDLA